MDKIYISETIDRRAVAMLEESFEVVQGTDIRDMARQAQGCSAMLVRVAKVTAEVMDAVPTLRVIAKHGMGVDNIDVEHATKKGILVVNAPLSNLNAVAEHIVMLTLALSKQTVLLDKVTRGGGFSRRTAYTNRELRGATFGIIGFGKISRLVAEKLSGFGMEIIASDPFVTQEDVEGMGVAMVPAAEVYGRSDYVLVHTSLTKATYHLIGAAEFAAMKKKPYFINAARGSVVDETALIEALRSGQIAGAGLDVFEQEPPADDNPLFTMDNVVLSPHNAALTGEALLAMAMDSAAGIADYLSGRRPAYPVNPEVLAQ
ncbi:MAG: hydroxyacid dehydrogenase [Oscillospiraceae bacterium]|nr:hydroxyacid dehydrogenase [Oscillospiraceae bacterium]